MLYEFSTIVSSDCADLGSRSETFVRRSRGRRVHSTGVASGGASSTAGAGSSSCSIETSQISCEATFASSVAACFSEPICAHYSSMLFTVFYIGKHLKFIKFLGTFRSKKVKYIRVKYIHVRFLLNYVIIHYII